ncbi:two-component system, OmpR family, response regulator ResD [Mesobacillus persicus]|uniref:Two-component system, OmpR family, response regulator ResD n=1 Tax=Mesobacillus persicus TaxID=930146 RepID=A0A1H7W0L2_9BACI|nr:response regulator transcription factor [Mesobacillus persicus]SEM15036.1 two-component system, OmpR family, response regulator ResD [Mesobacillus persicus]
MKKILVVDDEFQMRQLLRLYLQQENYLVEEAENGKEAFDLIVRSDFDLMILDVMMPIMDGWQTIEQVRQISDIPIMMLTAKGAVEDKVTGLTRGADDYLVKPFEEAELMARVQALLRRSKSNHMEAEVLIYKGVRLNLSARDVSFANKKLNLTQTEFDLLEAMIKHKGKALSREQLVDLVWGIEFMGEDRTVDSHIRNLRDKLKVAGVDKSFVQTVWGIGYKIE